MKIITKSEEETLNLAEKLAKKNKKRIWFLRGNLGVGKTVFVKGFARGLGVKSKLTSPTFNIIKTYKIKNSKELIHIDTYKLKHGEELLALGLEELIEDENKIILIEWPEKVEQFVSSKLVKTIEIKHVTENEREIEIK